MRSMAIVLSVGLLLLSGCERKPTVVLHDAMKDVVAPQAQIVWDVANNAQDDDGKPDPSKLTDGDWAKIADAGRKLKDQATAISDAAHLTVAPPGQKIQDEENSGASTAAQVQGFIAADPQGFAAFAKTLAEQADKFTGAAQSRDAAKLADAAGSLDQVCESCHVKYWYPQQAAGK